MPGSASARMSLVRRPSTFFDEDVSTRPWASIRRSSSSGLMPCLRAKPATACAGADLAGPRTRSSVSACRSGRPSARSTSRRGVASRRDRFVRDVRASRKAGAGFRAPSGSSNRGSLRCRFRAGKAGSLRHLRRMAIGLLIHPCLRHAHRQFAHSLNHADALGDADGAARIERIK